MNNHTLNDLMTFVTVVDEQSFTRAADRLNVTHSVVSKRITRLESSLNARLLNRTTRRLMMTEPGQALYERCSQIKQDIEEATLAVASTHDRPYGTLRVNAPMSFGQIHLAPVVCDFIKAYPDIKVELVLGRQYANLLEHNLDLSIQISELPDSSFIAKRLALRSTHICASPEYFKTHGIPKTPDELKEHNCLIYQSHKMHDEWHFAQNDDTQVIKVQGNLHVNSSQAIQRAAIKGLGIARLPGYLTEQAIAAGKLASVLHEYCPHDIGIYAVYPHNRHLATKVRVFIDFIAERFSQEHHWNEV